MRKYSLDVNSEKKILIKEEKDSESAPPQPKLMRLSVDNSAIPQSVIEKEVDNTKEILQIWLFA